MPVKLVLVGMMGSGKSTVGKLLSATLQLPLIETDAVIEKTYGSIPALFEKGEAHFRALEMQTLTEICKQDGFVLSTGGGILTTEENATILRENATVIYLDADGETLFERCRGTDRPLAKDKAKFLDLLSARDGAYRAAADYVVDTRGKTVAAELRALHVNLRQSGGTQQHAKQKQPNKHLFHLSNLLCLYRRRREEKIA